MKMTHRLSFHAAAFLVGACVLGAPETTLAQDGKVSLYAGYAFFKTDDANLNGARLSPEYHLNSFASVVGDFSYEKGSVDSTSTTVTTYLGGVRLKRGVGSVSLYVHALAGGVKTAASIKPFGGVTISAADTGLGLDGGGGLEFKRKGNLKLRAGGDYIRRKVDDINVSDVRATVGVVF